MPSKAQTTEPPSPEAGPAREEEDRAELAVHVRQKA